MNELELATNQCQTKTAGHYMLEAELYMERAFPRRFHAKSLAYGNQYPLPYYVYFTGFLTKLMHVQRFHGGYQAVSGGVAGNAFETLTGGVQEQLPVTSFKYPETLFSRLNNALLSGSVVACSVAVCSLNKARFLLAK